MDFIKKNWKLCTVYGVLIVAIIASVIVLCVKCAMDARPNGTIVIDGQEFEKKISRRESFILVVGQYDCHACQMFNDTLREYTKNEVKVYYIYADNDNDININDAISLIKNKLKELPKERNITQLLTPTTIFIEDGIFKDAYQGHVKVSDVEEYEEFKKIIEGHYVKRKIELTVSELIEKVESNEEFVFTIGQHSCGGCQRFETTINRYLQEGNEWYYLYVDGLSEEDNALVVGIYNQVMLSVAPDRDINYRTPLTVYVKDGVYQDAYLGIIDTYNETQYEMFKDFITGGYVGEAFPFV